MTKNIVARKTMSFSPKVKEDALVECGRCCCICHIFCGLKIEIHHIRPRAEDGENTLENAIPLCFNCHADMRSYDANHPKGTKYTESELRRHRDSWFKKVRESNGVPNGNSVVETDKIIYKKLISTLPWAGSLKFIKNTTFAKRFDLNSLKQLEDFRYLNDDPSFEFVDCDLESAKCKLLDQINIFMELIGRYTFPDTGSYNFVPPELLDSDEELFWKQVNEIRDAVKLIFDAHIAITRMGTRKLGILSPDQANTEKKP
jgi:hypothetical protein